MSQTVSLLDIPLIDEEYNSILTTKIRSLFRYFQSNNNNNNGNNNNNFMLSQWMTSEDRCKDGALFLVQCITAIFIYMYSSTFVNQNTKVRTFQSPGMKALHTSMNCFDNNSTSFWLWLVYSIGFPRVLRFVRTYMKRHLIAEQQQIRQHQDILMNQECKESKNIQMYRLGCIRRHRVKRVLLSLMSCTPMIYWCCHIILTNRALPPTLSMFSSNMKLQTTLPKTQHVNYSYTQKRILYSQFLRTLISVLTGLFFLPTGSDLSPENSVEQMLHSDRLQNSLTQTLMKAWSRMKQMLPTWKKSTDECCNICLKHLTFMKSPYILSPCGHICCYLCIRMKALEYCEEKLTCQSCGTKIESSSPYCTKMG